MLNRLEDVKFVDVREDLYYAGYHPEDGPQNPVHGSAYFFVGETPDGYRFQLDHVMSDNCHLESSEEGFHYFVRDTTVTARVEALMKKIQAHLDGGGRLDPLHWAPIQGCYGSAGWDESAELALEMAEGYR